MTANQNKPTIPQPMTHKQRRHVRNTSRRALKLAVLGTTGLGLACGARADTTITFEGFTANNTSIASIPGYGDNVSANSTDYSVSLGAGGILGTPDIALDWLGTWDSYTGWDGRGSVAQSDFQAAPNLSLQFTPIAGVGVNLKSFDLDEWAGGGEGSLTWSITGPNSGTLASGIWTMTTAGGRSAISPGVTGQLGEALTLNLELGSGDGTYFALDNLTFTQVPEPTALGLGALGAVMAVGARAMRRGRRA